MSLLARLTGLLGGLAWLVRWLLDGSDAVVGGLGADDAAYWLGLVLLAVSLAAYGAGLVAVGWLEVVVGVALPLLVWSVLEVLRGEGGGAVVDGVAGLVVLVVSLLGLAGPLRARQRSPRSGTGTHAR